MKNLKIINFLSMLLILALFSCTRQLFLYSKASIDPDSGWHSYEACGYECKPLVDFIEHDGIKIRLECFNYKEIFTIFSIFVAKEQDGVTIDPEKTYVNLVGDRTIYAKPKRAGYTKEEYAKLVELGRDYTAYRRAIPALRGDLSPDTPWWPDMYCIAISFFFDVTPPPHPSEEFEFHIEGLKKNGENVVVPVIKFGPAIRDSGGGIPLETNPNE
jgi:hypothetical protein